MSDGSRSVVLTEAVPDSVNSVEIADLEIQLDVLDVQVERVRCVVRCFKDRQSLSLKVCVDSLTLIDCEDEAQVGRIRLQQRQPPEVVRTVARNDTEPPIQQVVRLFEHGAIVNCNGLAGLCGLLLEGTRIGPVQHKCQ